MRQGYDKTTAVVILTACLFALLSLYVRISPPTADDLGYAFLSPYATPILNQLATEITAMGGLVGALTIAVIVGTVLHLTGHRTLGLLLPVGVTGASVLVLFLKMVFRRERPVVPDSPVFHASGSSYPSGHTTTGTVLMLLLAYVIHELADGRREIAATAAAAAVVMIALIGTSRVYLGVHHPTDVAGGILIGTLWAAVCVRFARRHLDGG